MARKRLGPAYLIDKETGCWLWAGCTDGNGYGRMYHPGLKKSYLAHRFYYEQRYGEAPGTLDHLCRTPGCVNPEHLEPCSRQENVRRGRRAKLTWDDARFIRASSLSNKDVAVLVGISAPVVCNIRKGRAWVEGT